VPVRVGPPLSAGAAGRPAATTARPLVPRTATFASFIVLRAGVHALRTADTAAVTLLAGGLVRPLDQLTAGQLRAWLQARYERWPTTANPHLLVNQSTAGGTGPVGRSYIHAAVRQLGITAQGLRTDRIHSEAQATGGDPLQLTRLVGTSDPTAIRYCAELGLIDDDARVGRRWDTAVHANVARQGHASRAHGLHR
jgi:hypothetical protein